MLKFHERLEKDLMLQRGREIKIMKVFKANWAEIVKIFARNYLHVRKIVLRHCVLCTL
jgi:hypothetical protein